MTQRPNFNEYFMLVARVISVRSTCRATPVGAVIVKENQIISTGYNGSPSGDEHCTENRYCYPNLSLCTDSKVIPSRSIHAEMNAIAHAAKVGVQVAGATIYSTLEPCQNCLKLIIASGIKEIYFETPRTGNITAKDIKITQVSVPELTSLDVANRVVRRL